MTATLEAPAAGAPLVQVAIATVFALVTTAELLALVSGHRSGRSRALARAGDAAARLLRLQPWAALPVLVAGTGLVLGAFGVFWDISLHIGQGRDEGPLANPAHYFVLTCLYACFAAGVLAMALHDRSERQAPRALRLPGGMRVPVGGALLTLCGVFSLSGFPLDDAWHRMFGQDVTLWGPTHLVMINGAILSLPALTVLILESRRASGHELNGVPRSPAEAVVRAALPAALLFAVAFWATEFDWGIPQYRLVWHPLLLALGSALALVAARMWLGRGGALVVVAIYIVARGAIELAVAGLGEVAPAMPLFVVEALLVEAVALRTGRRSPLRLGLLAGALCGTLGFAAEYAWTHVAAPLPWSPGLIAEGLPTALGAGLAGGVLGALLGCALLGRLPARPVRRRWALGAAALLTLLGANALWVETPRVGADVTLTRSGDGHEAWVSARLDPPEKPRRAEWFTALAWQGGGVEPVPMRELGGGLWRSERPLPIAGDWKTMLRLQKGRALVSVPLHLPREPSIPTPGLTRPDSFSATFVPDVEVMQTERRDYVPGWLWTPAALLMLAACAAFIAALATGIARATEAAPAIPRPAARTRTRLPR